MEDELNQPVTVSENKPSAPIEGLEKAAIFMLTLGPDEAAEVLKFFGPRDVNRLLTKMTQMKDVKQEKVEAVTREFMQHSLEQSDIGTKSDGYIRDMLNKALGEERAGFLADRLLQSDDTSGIESLKWVDASSVAELIKSEHPQIIATILVHLERDHAAAILNEFPERVRKEVTIRISTLDGVQPNALKELNEVLSKVLAGGEKVKKSTMGGTKTAAEILNYVGTANEQTVIEGIREYDDELAQSIQDEMFVFDNLMELDARSLQLALREVDNPVLVLALKGAAEPLKDKIFANLSSRAADAVRDELFNRGPVRISDVEAAQKEVLRIVKRLADEGEIVLNGAGDDAYV
ncbi:MAG: flagellar motor switch protein FliG [Limnobacter sp.]|nr:flagellar motor switch protein FliG [Limnobacter sp.]